MNPYLVSNCVFEAVRFKCETCKSPIILVKSAGDLKSKQAKHFSNDSKGVSKFARAGAPQGSSRGVG